MSYMTDTLDLPTNNDTNNDRSLNDEQAAKFIDAIYALVISKCGVFDQTQFRGIANTVIEDIKGNEWDHGNRIKLVNPTVGTLRSLLNDRLKDVPDESSITVIGEYEFYLHMTKNKGKFDFSLSPTNPNYHVEEDEDEGNNNGRNFTCIGGGFTPFHGL